MSRQPVHDSPASHAASCEQLSITHISKSDAVELLDRQARKYLGMSGEDFQRRYREGAIEDPDRSEVIRVSLLLPLAEE